MTLTKRHARVNPDQTLAILLRLSHLLRRKMFDVQLTIADCAALHYDSFYAEVDRTPWL